ncbi:MAG TPA: hypothetical protein VI732_05990 [Alphaproteobacteria bacterium]|jgi:hypothetical protein|nr:hypothetical protein [Alphaproteobacteria bacterium]
MTFLRWTGRLSLMALALGVAACGNPFAGAQPTHNEILASGWVAPVAAPRPGVIYCYRTLASPDCRKSPEPGQEDRLVSYDGGDYGSPPR